MGLAGAGVTEQHDWFAGVHVVPAGQLPEDGGRDSGHGIDIEVRQAFQPRELGVVDAPGAAPFGAVVDLGGEDFGEVTQVGVAFPVGDLGEADRFGADVGRCNSRAAAPIEACAAASTVAGLAVVVMIGFR